MPSFVLGRVVLRSGTFSTTRMLPTLFIFSNRRLTSAMQRSLVTTSSDFSSGSAADSKPEPESKSKSKDRKAGSSTKVAGKGKTKRKAERPAEMVVKQKSTVLVYGCVLV
jgi:hypothetical protein